MRVLLDNRDALALTFTAQGVCSDLSLSLSLLLDFLIYFSVLLIACGFATIKVHSNCRCKRQVS